MASLVVVASLFAVYLLTTLPPREQQATPEKFVVPDVPVDADAALQTYKQNCLSCHGGELQGKIGPALANVGAKLTKEQIYKRIEQGGGGMPKFEGRLSEDQLVTLAIWLAGNK